MLILELQRTGIPSQNDGRSANLWLGKGGTVQCFNPCHEKLTPDFARETLTARVVLRGSGTKLARVTRMWWSAKGACQNQNSRARGKPPRCASLANKMRGKNRGNPTRGKTKENSLRSENEDPLHASGGGSTGILTQGNGRPDNEQTANNRAETKREFAGTYLGLFVFGFYIFLKIWAAKKYSYVTNW